MVLFRVDVLDEAGGYSAPKRVWLDDCVGEDKRTCGDNGAFPDDGVIEDGGSHADERVVVDGCSVQCDVVPDAYIVAYFYNRFLVKGVKYRAVLDIYAVSDADGVDIAS